MARLGFYALVCLLCVLPCSALASPAPDIEVAFSPYGNSLQLVLFSIDSAQKSILVAAYSFTSKPIATALLNAHSRGVDVRVVADKKANSGRYTAVTFLANQGVPVRLNDRYAILHDKFMILDGKHIQTGSFNYTAAAVAKNAENVLVLQDVSNLVVQYAREWERLWSEGEDVEKRY